MLESLAEEELEEKDEPSTIDLHSGGVHVSEWTPRYCPECGTVNKFQDEVRCADCKVSLGSEAYTKHKMRVCPNCGSTRGYEAVPGYEPVHAKAGCTGPECRVKAN